ncbi:MAG: glycosyltransferase family 4 protein [Patescibacteria group bacterium]|nr:glycosyltransferase family 4 protein [Patescibacteria group bacterium]
MDSSPQKFLLFTLEFPPLKGGVATLYQNYAAYWPAGDLSVLSDAIPGGKDSEFIKYRSLIARHLRPRWLPAIWQLHREISNIKYPISNIRVIVGQILPLGIAAYYLSKFIKFKYAILLHGLDFSLATETKRKKKITAKILARADKIICSNSYTANQVKVFDSSLASKLSMVNPGIEPSFIRNPRRVQELRQQYGLENKIVLFGLGRLVRRKGFDKVIEAMSMIIKSASEVIYAIAGAGPDGEMLKKMAEALPAETKDKIIFLGQVSDADRWAWLELCDIFIMPSRNISGDYEGFGTVYLEANLAGKPVIAGDSGGVRDAVIDNISGLLVNPESPAEIAQAAIKLAADSELRRALGEQGKRRAVENFSAKKMAEKIYNIMLIRK